MIYELCVVQSGDATDESVAKLTETLRSVLTEYNGELMIQDNWGVKTLAQPTSTGKETETSLTLSLRVSLMLTKKSLED